MEESAEWPAAEQDNTNWAMCDGRYVEPMFPLQFLPCFLSFYIPAYNNLQYFSLQSIFFNPVAQHELGFAKPFGVA